MPCRSHKIVDSCAETFGGGATTTRIGGWLDGPVRAVPPPGERAIMAPFVYRRFQRRCRPSPRARHASEPALDPTSGSRSSLNRRPRAVPPLHQAHIVGIVELLTGNRTRRERANRDCGASGCHLGAPLAAPAIEFVTPASARATRGRTPMSEHAGLEVRLMS